MKTVKFTSAITILSLVLFLSVASYAGTRKLNTGELTNSGENSLVISNTSEKDYSYLRFDVNKYSNENEETGLIHNSLDYLRFNVNKFIKEDESEVIELPVANEFEYLRFDVNNFTESNSVEMIELPVNEYDHLRFDVNNFVNTNNSVIDELPVTE
jgi:hypothetical protein